MRWAIHQQHALALEVIPIICLDVAETIINLGKVSTHCFACTTAALSQECVHERTAYMLEYVDKKTDLYSS